MLLLLLACALGDPGPASPGSASAQGAAQLAELAETAGRIEAQAIELEEVAAQARDLADPAERAAAVADVQARMERLQADSALLRQQVDQLESGLRQAAGDPAPPGSGEP